MPRTPLTVVGGTKRRIDGRPKHVKLSAVLAAEASGVVAAERATGIPESTIRYWMAKPEFAEIRAKTREDLAEEYKAAAHLTVARLVELVPVMEPRDVIFATETVMKLSQLLTGQATSRSETRDLTDALDDDELEKLRDGIDRLFAEVPA